MMRALEDIIKERARQKKILNLDDFDKGNSQNDWVSYITAYAGRASQKVLKNEKQNENFRDNMIKVGALAVAAIEAYDNKYC
jgi:hypothetical protein